MGGGGGGGGGEGGGSEEGGGGGGGGIGEDIVILLSGIRPITTGVNIWAFRILVGQTGLSCLLTSVLKK